MLNDDRAQGREKELIMQEKTSQAGTEPGTLNDWEFKLDGTFTEKPIGEVLGDNPDGDWDKALRREGWTNTISLSSDTQVIEARIWRKNRMAEFLIDLWDSDRALGLIYCANLPTLLEFFRRYESFLSLGRKQEWNEAISNVNRYLFDDRNGLEIVQRIETKERAAEARYKQSRKAQSAQKTSS
jgi:hypothetical protein